MKYFFKTYPKSIMKKNRYQPLIILSVSVLTCITLLSSCSSKEGGNDNQNAITDFFTADYYDHEAFEKLTTAPTVDTTDTLIQKKLLNNDKTLTLQYAYQLNKHKPFWFSNKGVRQAAIDLPEQINTLKNEGVLLSDSTLKVMNAVVEKLKSKDAKFSTDELYTYDKTLTDAYFQVAHLLLMGNNAMKNDKEWLVENDSNFYAPQYLVNHFEKQNSFPSFDTFRSTLPEYGLALKELKFWDSLDANENYKKLLAQASSGNASAIDSIMAIESWGSEDTQIDTLSNEGNAIRKYQKQYGVKTSGKLDEATLAAVNKKPEAYKKQLLLNMERMRAMPRILGKEHIFVNIPQLELRYMLGNELKFSSRVIVGTTSRQTPSISSPMTNIVFNPPWGVPSSILKNEIAPGVARSGAGYLRRKGLRAYDSRGRDVTAQVSAGNVRKYFVSQPPGARNALGEIKFNLPNKEAIYIHDTPNRSLFGNSNRFLSHGCVRTENPKLLAETILGSSQYPISKIDSIINTRQTKSQDLNRKIPVFITYLTICSNKDSKRLCYLQDVYKRDEKMSGS